MLSIKLLSHDDNKGRFVIDYSLRQNTGWKDEIGRLSEDFMVLSDNNYFQNLSYTVQSPKTFDQIVDPVNRLLHTSGLKNFADTGITNITKVSMGSSLDSTSSATLDIVTENRVDTLNFFDLQTSSRQDARAAPKKEPPRGG